MSKPHAGTRTGAKITLTVELTNLGSWGPDCTLDQVYRQAREAAVGRLNKVFKEHLDSTRILGPIIVEAVTTDLEKR